MASAIPWLYPKLRFVVSHAWGIGVFLVGLAAGLRSGLNRFFLHRLDAFEAPWSKAFVATFIPLSTCVWLGCYLLTSSFDYRLIYALPACIVLIPFLATTGLRGFRCFLSRLLLAGLAISLLNPLLIYSRFSSIPHAFAVAMWIDKISDFVVMPLIAGLFVAMMLQSRRVESVEPLEPVLSL